MNKSYKNNVQLTGQLTKVFRTHTFDNGSTTCTFGLVTKKTVKKKNGEQIEIGTYHNCVANNKLQQIIAELSSGDWIDIIGEIQSRSYEQNGEKKYVTEIFILEIKSTNTSKEQDDAPIDASDVPF